MAGASVDARPQLEPAPWTVAELEAAKGGRTVSVVLPALNEEETVGSVVDTIVPLLGGLVDELVVLDSGSTDRTEIRAVAAGARVVSREVALPEVDRSPARARCCGVRWPPPPATWGCSSTPTSSTPTPCSCPSCSARCSSRTACTW